MNKSILTLHNKSILFFSFMGLFFGLVVNQTIYPVALYSMIISLFFIILLSFYNFSTKLKTIHFIVFLMIASCFVKILSVFFFESLLIDTLGMPFLSYNDDYVYDVTSSNILSIWSSRGFGFYSDIPFNTGFYSGYPNISAFSKFLFGDHYLVPRFLNVFFSTLMIPFYFATIKTLNNNKNITKIATILLAFSPAFIVYSSLQLKDTILVFFVATLLYGTALFFSKGLSFRSLLIVSFSMMALIFFRAAILVPYIIALIFAVLATKEIRSSKKNSKVRSFLWITLVFLCFYFFWEYLYNSGLLSLTGEEYLESRFSIRGASDSYQGSNDLGKLGIIAVLLGPILAVLSLFLPAPIYMQLDQFSNAVPYHYIPLLGYYAILPMVCVALLYIVKNYRLNKIGLFIVSFLILYKIGQAGGKSILDSRQSLPAIYAAYLLLAYFDLKNTDIQVLWKRYRVIIILTMLLVMFSVTFLRYLVRL